MRLIKLILSLIKSGEWNNFLYRPLKRQKSKYYSYFTFKELNVIIEKI
jgi:hypothetical protein